MTFTSVVTYLLNFELQHYGFLSTERDNLISSSCRLDKCIKSIAEIMLRDFEHKDKKTS